MDAGTIRAGLAAVVFAMIDTESFPKLRSMVTRPPASRLPAARRRRQLLDVSLELFAARGYHTTSMNDIAEAAGVTKPVLYQHFRSKRELYLELLEDVGGRLRDVIGKATSEAPNPREQVQAGFLAYFTFVSDQRTAFQLLFGGGSRRDVEFADAVRDGRAVDRREHRSADRRGRPRPDQRRLLAHGIVGLAEGTSRHWVANGLTGSPAELADHVAALAWAGLRGISGYAALELRVAVAARAATAQQHSSGRRSYWATASASISRVTSLPRRKPPALEGLVPVDAEVLTVELAGRAEADAGGAPRRGGGAFVGDLEVDRPGHVVEREVAVTIHESPLPRRTLVDLNVIVGCDVGVEEVGRTEVRIALVVVRIDAGELDFDFDGRVSRVLGDRQQFPRTW